MQTRHIILRPLDKENSGTGHMRRMFRLAIELNRQTDMTPVFVVDNPRYWKNIIPEFPGSVRMISTQKLLFDNDSIAPCCIVIFDQRETVLKELKDFLHLGMPILLDDDGPARSYAPFVIDSIPGPRRTKANQNSVAFLDLPSTKREPDLGGDILLGFGNQDPGNITVPVLDFLSKDLGIFAGRITVTNPVAAKTRDNANGGFQILNAPQSLHEHLHRYGLVICSYGLTAIEALAAGTAVITIDPSPYHARLSKQLGLHGIGHYKPGGGAFSRKQKQKLKRIIRNPAALIESHRRALQKLDIDSELRRRSEHSHSSPSQQSFIALIALIRSLSQNQPNCNTCNSPLPEIIARFSYRSYYRCSDCGMIGMYRLDSNPDEYGRDYFTREYRDQYGRTYLEDFQAIKSMGQSRIEMIKPHKPSGKLLDIGCAFGPFLNAAHENGFEVYGIDISQTAVEYVERELGFKAGRGEFPSFNPTTEFKVARFDVVTLWYVIEHFRRLEPVLTRLADILSPGGLLAFSTPNGSGISARRSLNDFLKNSPSDHYTIWTPRTAKKILSRYGFKVLKTRITGHHPERILRGVRKDCFLYRMLMDLSRICGLGDTFEIYALKE